MEETRLFSITRLLVNVDNTIFFPYISYRVNVQATLEIFPPLIPGDMTSRGLKITVVLINSYAHWFIESNWKP